MLMREVTALSAGAIVVHGATKYLVLARVVSAPTADVKAMRLSPISAFFGGIAFIGRQAEERFVDSAWWRRVEVYSQAEDVCILDTFV